jgi:hypothetical protein
MDIQQIIKAAETTSNAWIGEMIHGKTQAILTFGTRKAADATARELREAGAEIRSITRTPYKEWILTVSWK